jgi:hypothetical protein
MNVPLPPAAESRMRPNAQRRTPAHGSIIEVGPSEPRSSWGGLRRSGSLRSPPLRKPPQLEGTPCIVKVESRIM